MGRKIPGKKHRGVKDPLKQQAQRMLRLKSKINAPPLDPDDQPVPKSLTRLFAVPTGRRQRAVDAGALSGAVSAVAGVDHSVRRLRRAVGEDARAFSQRISNAARLLVNPPRHYPSEEEEMDVKGARIARQRERRRRRVPRSGAALDSGSPPPAPVPASTLPLIDEVQYERVPFGEVAREPPTLRRAFKARRGLLLTGLLEGGAKVEQERARLAAVAAYRDLKKNHRKPVLAL